MTEPPKRLKVTFDVPNVIMERANWVAENRQSCRTKPLSGASDCPWTARGLDFLRLTCHECRSLVLYTHDPG